MNTIWASTTALGDQPRIGVTSDKVVDFWDDYSASTGAFTQEQGMTITKTALENGSTLTENALGPWMSKKAGRPDARLLAISNSLSLFTARFYPVTRSFVPNTRRHRKLLYRSANLVDASAAARSCCSFTVSAGPSGG